MRKKSVGEILRTAREYRGLTLVEVQRITRIHARYLQALEYNDFDSWGNPDAVREYLSIYADALELDADVLVAAYDTNSLVEYYEEGEEEVLAAQLKRNYKVPQKKKSSYLPLFYLLLIASLIFIFITYVVHSRLQNQARLVPTDSSYSSVSQVTSEASSASTTEVSSSTASSSSTDALATENITVTGSGDALVATVRQTTYPVTVTLTAENTTSWISLSNTELAGGVTLGPEYPTISTTIVEGVTSVNLVLGVVKGVSVTVGGQQVDTSAITSETGTVTINFEQ
ncbi:helix-turn-helix domain-containing protein [Streptococcus suis]|nr:helix-turn-helix domain-containing protein [Streptococcus suis]NQJ77775.1 helix-turn-helix domain-containing protein [Streptococcus suis]HEL2738810.1 helix-turn-helix domain-containing protein [Streptococcus suis]HEL9598104.1 helix-turn-helix domain-containing protein [Streptococcus suis]